MLEQELPKISEVVLGLLWQDNYLVIQGKKEWKNHIGLHCNENTLLAEVHKILPRAPMESITRLKRKLFQNGSWIPQNEAVLKEYVRVRNKHESIYHEFFSPRTERPIRSDELEVVV
jgi:hypothetical protein